MSLRDELRRYLVEDILFGEPVDDFQDDLDLFEIGLDSMGILKVTAFLEEQLGRQIQPEELTTDHVSAPMSGGLLFSAKARLRVPAATDAERLREDLERIADDLMVDLTLVQAVIGGTARG